ncbi:hypothetical protein SCHPADRAFT_897739 [Schizopora paradoxa]|uniref:DUF6534 domain-containing protein n=1 Tax=Schizopora paradoxa TaxID=27342 RepID=A0A0H2S9F3_9AGAM|nr:hypothetical protein SCHPADRAFT_897739 [Schizopora paradoxa]
MVAIDANFGATFDGLTISLILYGVTCGQAIFFFRTYYARNELLLKTLVGGTWVVDTFHTVLIIHSTWHYLISKISPQALQTANWSIITQIIPTEIIAVAVDCYFVHRIWRLSNSNKTMKAMALLLPTICAYGVSIAYVVKCYRFPAFVDAKKEEWLLGTFSSLRMAVDIAIACSMCILLYSKRDLAMPRTRLLLKNLIQFTVATGLLTSMFTTAYIISAFTMPSNMIYIGIYFVHGKVYLNSMLAALNSRDRFKNSVPVVVMESGDTDLEFSSCAATMSG